MQTTPALPMPEDRHPADQAVTLPKKQRKSICILDEFFVGKISDGQQVGARQSLPVVITAPAWCPVVCVHQAWPVHWLCTHLGLLRMFAGHCEDSDNVAQATV